MELLDHQRWRCCRSVGRSYYNARNRPYLDAKIQSSRPYYLPQVPKRSAVCQPLHLALEVISVCLASFIAQLQMCHLVKEGRPPDTVVAAGPSTYFDDVFFPGSHNLVGTKVECVPVFAVILSEVFYVRPFYGCGGQGVVKVFTVVGRKEFVKAGHTTPASQDGNDT